MRNGARGRLAETQEIEYRAVSTTHFERMFWRSQKKPRTKVLSWRCRSRDMKKKNKNRNKDANEKEMRRKREGDVCLRKVSVDLNTAALFSFVQRGEEVFLHSCLVSSSFSSWCSYKFQPNVMRSSAALYHMECTERSRSAATRKMKGVCVCVLIGETNAACVCLCVCVCVLSANAKASGVPPSCVSGYSGCDVYWM